jgi:hypothetical protein
VQKEGLTEQRKIPMRYKENNNNHQEIIRALNYNKSLNETNVWGKI